MRPSDCRFRENLTFSRPRSTLTSDLAETKRAIVKAGGELLGLSPDTPSVGSVLVQPAVFSGQTSHGVLSYVPPDGGHQDMALDSL